MPSESSKWYRNAPDGPVAATTKMMVTAAIEGLPTVAGELLTEQVRRAQAQGAAFRERLGSYVLRQVPGGQPGDFEYWSERFQDSCPMEVNLDKRAAAYAAKEAEKYGDIFG